MNILRLLLTAGILSAPTAFATSVEPTSLAEQAAEAELIARGTVESVTSRRGENGIVTDATIAVTEIFRGNTSSHFTLTYRGGVFGTEGETITEAPDLRIGEDRVFFLTNDDGVFRLSGGPAGAPFAETEALLAELRQLFPNLEKQFSPPIRATSESERRHAALAAGTEGLLTPPRRTITPDRNEPIGYLVDADFLPSGISLGQALDAIDNALSAWTAASSAQFRFDGLTSFGTSANQIDIPDQRLRIQLHDSYGAIAGNQVLGIGGQRYQLHSAFPNGGSGGRVFDVEFHKTTTSFVVLNHTAASMQNLATFEAVLGHEIGHALGLAHSSENQTETNPELRDALMYYRVHSQGAVLNLWDLAAIRRVHPFDPPPFGFDRVIRAVTSSSPLANPEVNQIRTRGYSLHTDAISQTLHFPSRDNWTFDLSDSVLTYRPGGLNGGDEIDPASNSFYDSAYIRYNDGTHLSPPVSVRVISLLPDQAPLGAPDGLPDAWMEEHFGSRFPIHGLSRPQDDPDGDGVPNLDEFLSGTDPLDANSRVRVTAFSETEIEWLARPYDLYEIESSTDLSNWTWEATVQPTIAFGTRQLPSTDTDRRFYRVIRVD